MKIKSAAQRLILVLVALLGITFQGCILIMFFLLGIVVFSFDGTAEEFPADCAVVFGAAVHRGDIAGPGILRRVGTAVDLYKKGDVKRLFLTGGMGTSPYQTKSEAQVMRDVALDLGVDDSDIVLEEKSQSTWENIGFTKLLSRNCTSVIGVSDRYHLARIRFIARKQGWESLQTFPATVHPSFFFEANSVLREVLGLGYYTVFES